MKSIITVLLMTATLIGWEREADCLAELQADVEALKKYPAKDSAERIELNMLALEAKNTLIVLDASDNHDACDYEFSAGKIRKRQP